MPGYYAAVHQFPQVFGIDEFGDVTWHKVRRVMGDYQKVPSGKPT